MDEMNINVIDPGNKVVKPVDVVFMPVPVKITHPITAEFLQVSCIGT
jgi:hypothetical protein